MKYIIGICFSILITFNGYADSANPELPSNLVKVTKENNPKCVEYVTYQGDLYCTLVAMDKSPADPAILTYERQNVQFDNRPWKAAWGQKTDSISTVEYIPVGGDIDNWNELVTTQFMPGLTVTPALFKEQFINGLNKSGISVTVNTIEEQPDQLIFEFKVTKPENLQQDEIQKVVKGKDGLYIIHYAIKNQDMSKEKREQWIENLKKSSLKN